MKSRAAIGDLSFVSKFYSNATLLSSNPSRVALLNETAGRLGNRVVLCL